MRTSMRLLTLTCGNLQHKKTPSWYSQHSNPPETQHGWLTLSMDRQAMDKYVSESAAAAPGEQVKVFDGALNRSLVQAATNDCLASMNQSKNYQFQLRLAATKTDAGTILGLVHGLAVFEKEPDAVNMTVDDYIRDGFDSDQPLFYCLLLDHTDEQGKVHTAGMALVYFGYTLGEGRFLYLEDLFLEEAYRKMSGGSMAMQALARIGQACKCQRLYWQALDWNTPALSFYGKIGAKVREGELTSRYDGDSLKKFAQEGP
jgi:GNAT superfamily N-acetyltransferase